MLPTHKLWSGLVALLLTLAPPVAIAANDGVNGVDSGTAQQAIAAPSIIGEQLAIDDSVLDEIRGGFTTTSGLEIAFGIERALYINGNLISTTSLNVANGTQLAPVPPASSETITSAPAIDQLSPTAPPPDQLSQIAPAPKAPLAAPDTRVGSTASSTSAANQTALDTGAASLALIQTGAGNILQTGTVPPASMGTIIQNTLNNQKIQNVTVINATVNSMEILKALNLQSLISSAINDSVRK